MQPSVRASGVVALVLLLGLAGCTTRPASRTAIESLWIADSYTAGVGAAGPRTGEACLTAERRGWTCALDAVPASGFIAGLPLASRLARDEATYPRPDVVLVDGGRNDRPYPLARFKAAVLDYFDRLGRAYPDIPVVVIAPYYMYYSGFPDLTVRRHWLRDVVAARRWLFIDPVEEGWINASAARLTVADHHPGPAGHRYLARHLDADLDRLAVPRG